MGVYELRVRRIDGGSISLAEFRGKVLLIVNVASRCGFTRQYADLEALYRRLQHRGLEILAFPCNQFGRQEPDNDAEIRSFCTQAYAISFPLFAKIDVNGANAAPLYRFLQQQAPGLLGTKIRWNFTKFLVSRNGEVRCRYAPTRPLAQIESALSRELEM
jgi:glutathione peroxidase